MSKNFKKSLFADFLRYLREIVLVLTLPSKSRAGFFFNGNSQQKKATYEIEVAKYFKKNISNYELFINVGANTGYWPCFISSIHDLKVISLEPDYFNYTRHKINKLFNHFKKIEIIRVACGRENGVLELHGFGTGISGISGWAGGNSQRIKKIEQIRLDSLFEKMKNYQDRILILIDAEGLEWEILNGSLGIMCLNPVYIVEISTTEHQPIAGTLNPNFFATFDFMNINGFGAKTWVGGTLVEINGSLLSETTLGDVNFSDNNMFVFEKIGQNLMDSSIKE